MFKKIVTDSNVVAQESGIAALVAFLEFGGPRGALRLRSHIVTGLCEKGLSSSRAGTKQKTTDALLWFIELDTPDPVIEQMIPSLSAKLPKLVSGTVKALADIYSAFGAQTVSPKLVLPSLPKLFSHADRTVRAETSNLTVELYKWMGPALEQILFEQLKPVQQKDLTAAFQKVNDEKPTQTRFLKSQREAMEAQSGKQEDNGESGDGDLVMGGTEEETGQVDAYDLMDPVDVLSKIPDDLAAKISVPKWKDRLDALTEVHDALNVIKIADGDYLELVRVLAKCLKDVNIQVASLAANCTERLAKGLRKKFHKYYQIILGPLLERTKEKKQNVLDALNSALDAVFESTSLSDVLEATLEAMKHKTPPVRLASSHYLIRCLKETRVSPTRPEIESIITSSIKLVGDTLPGVRTNGFEAVGTLMKITGERELNSYLENVDDIKKNKIREFYETAEVKSKIAPPKPAKSAAAPTKSTGPTSKTPAKPNPTATKRKSLVAPKTSSLASKSSLGTSTTTTLSSSSSQQKKKVPASSSTIPSKRGPTSPLKTDPSASRIGALGNRGLTGRSLQSSTSSSFNNVPSMKQDNGLNEAERAELEDLRLQKQTWLKEREKLNWQVQESFAESSRLMTEIQTMSSKVDRLSEQHTNDVMTIKSKETQLQRAGSDLEISRLKISQLENEIQLLKKQRSSTMNTFPISSGFDLPSASSIESSDIQRQFSPLQESNGRPTIKSEFSVDQKSPMENIDQKVGSLSIDGDQKENNGLSRTMLDTNDESWRRAAEVTSQLKARIEKMKAKSRNNVPSSGYK